MCFHVSEYAGLSCTSYNFRGSFERRQNKHPSLTGYFSGQCFKIFQLTPCEEILFIQSFKSMGRKAIFMNAMTLMNALRFVISNALCSSASGMSSQTRG